MKQYFLLLRVVALMPMFLIGAIGFELRSASAEIVVDNLGYESGYANGFNGTNYDGSPTTEDWLANRFTVGAGVWNLDSLTVSIHTSSWGPFDPEQYAFEIRDGVGTPGTNVLGTFQISSNDVPGMWNPGNFTTLQADGLISLTGGNYWLVGRPTSPEAIYLWQLSTAAGDENAAPGWAIDPVSWYSNSAGTSWTPVVGFGPQTFSMSATQTAVPEPSSFALVALIAGGAWWKRRRR